jgi:hypothetical protein
LLSDYAPENAEVILSRTQDLLKSANENGD